MIRIASRIYMIVRSLGAKGAFGYLCKEKVLATLSLGVSNGLFQWPYKLYFREGQHPLLCRFGTSDRAVFNQIFIQQHYDYLDLNDDLRFIIDCGANVGYSTVYLATRFPNAHVLAIEPDEKNVAILQRNIAPYGSRVTVLHAAIWSHRTGLVVCKGRSGDRGEWSVRVRECENGESPDVLAVDIGSLLAQSAFQRIDILKVDIEGAEAQVFASNYNSWIDEVDTFLIELHDNRCREVFLNALSPSKYKLSQSDEITVARRVNVA